MIEVSPSDLRNRVEPHVRRAVIDGTAIPTPAMAGQGDMRGLLADRDRTEAVKRGFTHLTTGEIEQALADARADREGSTYRHHNDFAEHIEDKIDDLEVELDRRGAMSWIGR